MKKMSFIIIFLLNINIVLSINENNEKSVREVFDIVYYYVQENETNVPKISLKISTSDVPNAYAAYDNRDSNTYKVIITKKLIDDIIKNNKDAMALIIGHEIAHITMGHIEMHSSESTDYEDMIFTRSNEFQADTVGLKYAVGAGFSFKQGKKFIESLIKKGYEYSSFEGTGLDHPSWYERLEYLDKEKAKLWKTMAAFKNGVFFLNIEQFAPAILCFKNVISDFPDCSEAYANLGYALLMKYCDGFDEEAVKEYGIGQIVTGSFYKQPISLGMFDRGIDEDLWWDAVGNLKTALRIDPSLTLVYSNLGLAYLLKPQGKDIGKSTEYFEKAIELLKDDTKINDIAKSAIYLNYGVAYLSDESFDFAEINFKSADSLIKNYYIASRRSQRNNFYGLKGAILYNRAVILSRGDSSEKLMAKRYFEDYLNNAPKTTIWWNEAEEKYKSLCAENNYKLIAINVRHNYKLYKPVVSIMLDDTLIMLSERRENLKEQLQGKYIEQNVARNLSFKKLIDTQYDIEYLVSDKLLSIFLKGDNTPAVYIEKFGIGSKKRKIEVGMKIDDFNNIIAGMENSYSFHSIESSEEAYRYYLELGIAIKLDSDSNNITEIVIIQIPTH